MTVQMKISELKNPNFFRSLHKIASHPFKEFKTSYNITKIHRKLMLELKDVQEAEQKFVNEYAQKDDKGKLVLSKGPDGKPVPNSFELQEDKIQEYQDKMKAFEETEFKIECHKIRPDEIMEIGISALDLGALEPLIDVNAQPPAKLAAAPRP